MPTSVEVVAPSRLHFGMFSFGQRELPQYGGVGVMINRPGLRLRIAPAERFAATGPLAQRAAAVVELLAKKWHLHELPACRLDMVEAPPEHVGLGTGTQLALAVAAGLNAFRGQPPKSAAELAALTGRGARSAIGTYGFLHGGLLVERGKLRARGALAAGTSSRVARGVAVSARLPASRARAGGRSRTAGVSRAATGTRDGHPPAAPGSRRGNAAGRPGGRSLQRSVAACTGLDTWPAHALPIVKADHSPPPRPRARGERARVGGRGRRAKLLGPDRVCPGRKPASRRDARRHPAGATRGE